jgi:hypothetical protein
MENIFFQRNITRTFDLKGSSRARYVDVGKSETFDEALSKRRAARRAGKLRSETQVERVSQVHILIHIHIHTHTHTHTHMLTHSIFFIHI